MKITKKNAKILLKDNVLQKEDEYKPKIHLIPFSGLLNDPNGLCYLNGVYHVFYQWSPFSIRHDLKHWGHYSTKDFINYVHHKVALIPSIPEENNGCFTGATLVENNVAYIFYTGYIVEDNISKNKNAATILVLMNKEGEIKLEKKVLFKINKNFYTHEFRDPFPFKRKNDYFLLHGAQNKKKEGVLAIYQSKNIDSNYKLLGNITFTHLHTLGTMVECPNLFSIKDYDVLMLSPQKLYHHIENKERPIFIIGIFNSNTLHFSNTSECRFVDHGFEFYAPQVLLKEERVIMIGWLGNIRIKHYPNKEYKWANCLTIPREISIIKGWIYQNPIKELQKLRLSMVKLMNNMYHISSIKPYELLIRNLDNVEFEIVIENNKGENIRILYSNMNFFCIRDNMTTSFYSEFGVKRSIKGIRIKSLQIYLDISAIEIFINKGQYTMVGRYFIKNVTRIKGLKNIESTLYELKSLKIKYEDIL